MVAVGVGVGVAVGVGVGVVVAVGVGVGVAVVVVVAVGVAVVVVVAVGVGVVKLYEPTDPMAITLLRMRQGVYDSRDPEEPRDLATEDAHAEDARELIDLGFEEE